MTAGTTSTSSLPVPDDAGTAERVRADFPILATLTSKGKPLVYLDSAATSQKPRAVIDAISQYYEGYNANIHRGVYEIAERATEGFEGARARLAAFFNAADPAEIIFTRNATEAINLVCHTWGLANLRAGDAILLTRLEHHSNIVPWQLLAAKTGADLRFLELDDQGRVVLDDLEEKLRGVRLVAVTHVSNTLGTIVPVERIIPAAHAAGAVVLLDGAQAAPHLAVDVQALDVDFYAASGHKMLGPTGIGTLYGKRALLEAMPPFLAGGDMIRRVTYEQTTFNELPWKFEAGTSDIAGAIGLGAAVAYLQDLGMAWVRRHEMALTSYALERLAEQPHLTVYGPKRAEERGGVIAFTLGDAHPHDLASILDGEGVCVRAGHHCTMPLHERLGLTATARASFYVYNTAADVDALIEGLEKAARIFRL
ncbi:MAG TPA: cysteine desulfurase [Candidatus Dormibacteraeota bacterium]|nr:cysteine desulfurase [Candidatus Dormibacteraeota bacterium]